VKTCARGGTERKFVCPSLCLYERLSSLTQQQQQQTCNGTITIGNFKAYENGASHEITSIKCFGPPLQMASQRLALLQKLVQRLCWGIQCPDLQFSTFKSHLPTSLGLSWTIWVKSWVYDRSICTKLGLRDAPQSQLAYWSRSQVYAKLPLARVGNS